MQLFNHPVTAALKTMPETSRRCGWPDQAAWMWGTGHTTKNSHHVSSVAEGHPETPDKELGAKM